MRRAGHCYDGDKEGGGSTKDAKPTGYGSSWMGHDGVYVCWETKLKVEVDGWVMLARGGCVRLRVSRRCIETYDSSDKS